jgi:hypothetical protein
MQLLVAEPLKQKIGEDFDPPRSEPSGRRHPVHFAIECARQYPLGLDRATPVEVLLTPFAADGQGVRYKSPDTVEIFGGILRNPGWPSRRGFPGCASAACGRHRWSGSDLPHQTSPLRVNDTPDASATEADVQANPVGIIRPTFDILDAAQRLTKLRVLIIRPQPHTRPDPRAPQLPALSLPNQPVRGGWRRVRKGSKLTPITRYEKASPRV